MATAVSVFVCVNPKRNSKDDLFIANAEALANAEECVMDYVCRYLGCCGGQNKCFYETVSIGNAELSGTFYMN